MSSTDDGHNSYFPFGNSFRLIFSRKSHISPKFLALLNDFEIMLAGSLRSLEPKDSSEIFSLSWMIQALESLSVIHTNIKCLITDLQFPLSDWENSWMNVYLDDSIKLLDICIALSSELSRFDQGQLLLQYVLHILDPSINFPSSEQLKRAAESHHELMWRFKSRNPKLEHCHDILQKLAEKLYIGKVRNSSKGKVLMRALYGVKVETLFVCSIIIAVLSGSSKPLIELNVPEKFLWSKAFNELQVTILPEVRAHLSSEKVSLLKELEALEISAGRLHNLICKKQEKLLCQCNVVDSEEFASMEKSAENGNREEEVILSHKLSEQEERKRLQESVSDLAEKAEKLFEGVDILSSRVDDFFQILLNGRDALLANLRVLDQPEESNAVR
ncbi:hypothetical protein IEQ34_021982 [Dendrobium chrysotoxum]|uniref:Uncharacterized protein n=1 Tax=Dendrobium chrysotoxum TaxID=161865 RepID=A0AAV7FWD2_DENCH|nr:hypothetical protein IEQ34_021982 [Dendrobium chrysotoxum]